MGFFMALKYRNQTMIETMSAKTGIASYRLSEQRQILYGNRASKYDELVYLRGQNTDTATVNIKRPDAWHKFALANGIAGTVRPDQAEREFFVSGTFP